MYIRDLAMIAMAGESKDMRNQIIYVPFQAGTFANGAIAHSP